MKKPNIVYGRILKPLKDLSEKLFKSKRNILLMGICILLFFLLITKFKRIFFISLLTALGSFSLIYIRYVKQAYVLGIELCMFSTVLCARAYGTVTAMFVGFVSLLFGFVISGRVKPNYFISILTLPLVGAVASFLNHLALPTLGILMSVLYNIIILPLYMLTGSRILSSIVFFIINVSFNAWLFTNLAQFMLNLMVT